MKMNCEFIIFLESDLGPIGHKTRILLGYETFIYNIFFDMVVI